MPQIIEGNTNLEGSREGQGVYRRIKHKRRNGMYADWLWHRFVNAKKMFFYDLILKYY
ncbi:hypothetical protein N824_03260 [Pedobacter sp. V48]|nr:hypothetical protein N824_03260 [Pedobacter sp. V48]